VLVKSINVEQLEV